MTALETVAQKLITELAQAQCFGFDGRVQDREASHKILDVPFLHISMLDIVTATHCYANTCVAKRAGIPGGWLTSDRIHAIGLVFDPMSFQRVLSELDRYSQGATQSQSGVLTLISDADPDEQTFFTDYSTLVARSSTGENTYYAHFFCEMEHMEMVNAYAAFDLRDLTERQFETLSHLLQGTSYQDIASDMNITYKTLEKHVRAVYEVTGCQNQAALIDACNTL